ncbi:MAG: ketopantoate reductase family protein [Candidatus Binatia bacterium]
MQRMIVIGTGPIGGIIGGRLARAGTDITFVDIDQEHVSAIREKGLYVDVPDGPFKVKAKILYPNELHEIGGKFDIGFIAVRSNYTADALNTVLPHLAPDGLLVSMQNGINPPLLQEKVGADRTLGMAIRMGCRKIGPGHVQTDIRGHLYLGHLHGKTTPRLEELHKTLNAVMETDISDNILGVLWSKLTYTCLGYYGSLADASLATTCTTDADRRALADFFAEIVAVGEALGVRWIKLAEYYPADFHPRNSADKRLAAVNDFAKTWKPEDRKGPLRYVQKKIRTEVDFTLAYVVREGEKLGMKMPLCSKLLEIFRELEAGKRQFGQHNYNQLVATGR